MSFSYSLCPSRVFRKQLCWFPESVSKKYRYYCHVTGGICLLLTYKMSCHCHGLDWPQSHVIARSDKELCHAPAARPVHFAENVPPMYPFYYQCRSWLSLVKATANQIIYYTAIIYECLHVCKMNAWIAILPMLVVE